MVNCLRPGFERAIRTAPSTIDSSPGTLTTVKFKVRSFGRDRIVRENISYTSELISKVHPFCESDRHTR